MTKFINEIVLSDDSTWEIETPTGWTPIKSVLKTIPFQVWTLWAGGHELKAADTHLVYTKEGDRYLSFCIPWETEVLTTDGWKVVTSVIPPDPNQASENMYDLELNHYHRYYSNSIVSHNTTTVASYLLYEATFNEKQEIAILANKGETATEILGRIKDMFESLPWFIKPGVREWNKKSISLTNGSRIFASATSSSSIRGRSISLLYLDEFAFVDNDVDFYTSTYPVITSGKKTKVIITSCVTKDTYVFTPNGIQQVADFINADIPPDPVLGYLVPRYQVNGFSGMRSGEVFVNSGIAKTKVIETESTSIECSLDHKLWVLRNGKYGWVKARHINEDCCVLIKYGDNVWGEADDISSEFTASGEFPNTITEHLAYILGMNLIGRVFPVTDSKVDIVSNRVLTGFLPSYLPYTFNDKIYTVTSKDLVQFIEQYGSRDEIPRRLFSCSKNVVCAFISALFDNHQTQNKNEIRLKSKYLISQIRIFLLNLGILTKIKPYFSTTCVCSKYKIVVPSHYDLDITNANKMNKLKDISIFERMKWEKVEYVENSKAEVYDFSLDHVEGDPWCHSVIYNGIVGHQTPNGMNLFYKLWTDAEQGRNSYAPKKFIWDSHPKRDEQWKTETLANMSPQQFAVEMECQFEGSSNTLISGIKLQKLAFLNPIKSDRNYKVYVEPDKECTYVVTVDVAEGVGGDNSVVSVFNVSKTPYYHCAVYKSNEIVPLLLAEIVRDIATAYNEAYCLVESNGAGKIVADALFYDLEYENMVQTETKKNDQVIGEGYNTIGIKQTKKTKAIGCSMLKSMIESDTLITPDLETIMELSTFVKKGSSWAAETRKTDDIVMTLVLFGWLVSQTFFEDLVESTLKKDVKSGYLNSDDYNHLIFGFYHDGTEEDQ